VDEFLISTQNYPYEARFNCGYCHIMGLCFALPQGKFE